jgi:hypothetical protein
MRGLLKINDTFSEYLFDTGASQTIISTETYEKICNNQQIKQNLTVPSKQLTSANSELIQLGNTNMTLELGKTKFDVDVSVAELSNKQTILLGRDAISACPLFNPVMKQIEKIITETTVTVKNEKTPVKCQKKKFFQLMLSVTQTTFRMNLSKILF